MGNGSLSNPSDSPTDETPPPGQPSMENWIPLCREQQREVMLQPPPSNRSVKSKTADTLYNPFQAYGLGSAEVILKDTTKGGDDDASSGAVTSGGPGSYGEETVTRGGEESSQEEEGETRGRTRGEDYTYATRGGDSDSDCRSTTESTPGHDPTIDGPLEESEESVKLSVPSRNRRARRESKEVDRGCFYRKFCTFL